MGQVVCVLCKLLVESGCDASVVASALAFHPAHHGLRVDSTIGSPFKGKIRTADPPYLEIRDFLDFLFFVSFFVVLSASMTFLDLLGRILP